MPPVAPLAGCPFTQSKPSHVWWWAPALSVIPPKDHGRRLEGHAALRLRAHDDRPGPAGVPSPIRGDGPHCGSATAAPAAPGPIVVRAETRGGVTFDGGGAAYFGGISFNAGAHHRDVGWLQLGEWAPR